MGPASTLDVKDLPVMTELPLLGMPSLCSKDARLLFMIEAAYLKNWGLLLARTSLHSVNRSPASIREGRRANLCGLFRTVADSPSFVQPSACLRKCKCARNYYGTARTSLQVVASWLALSTWANFATVVEDR